MTHRLHFTNVNEPKESPASETAMTESSWWQQALESAIYETNVLEERIGLARLAILERLVSPVSADKNEEDVLFGALDTLRALEWERLSSPSEQIELLAG
jgi:hypothetical protein